ncbi:MAG: sugar ABC transporter ATP-binding protein [Spirochaetaceae bacterium]|jgi:ribose transport system ATP-binding protein|nr:sugar ABC transporter ATP-binding protein [Spirochaetaceae bacterium]
MEDEFAISLENIYKSFGTVTVLKGVNFHLKKGTINALVGGNGAGKSTLMKILNGVHQCDSGIIKINGKPIKISNTREAQKNGIKMIFQELSLSPTLTVTENVFLANEIKKGIMLNKKMMYKKTKQLLDELRIEVQPDDRIEDLGVGVCQLIEIVKALSVDAKILIMDEPTASLTEKETNILFSIIENLKKKGVSIIYISHRMKEIFRIADSITILRDGVIVSHKPVSEYTLDSVIELMTGNSAGKKMEFVKREKPAGKETVLSVKNLTVGTTVSGVSFEVKKGEVLGLAGLMGSGRTEIMEALFGRRKAYADNLFFNGKNLHIRGINEAITCGIALVPEDRRRYGLVLEHTLRENICLPNYSKLTDFIKINWNAVKDMTARCIKSLNIKAENHNAGMLSLSGGNQQKTVIAKWLETSPNLLLMDEPTAGVDIVAKSEIIEIVRRFTEEGNSVIFVSSELSEMLAICDRILVLNKGRIKQELRRDDIKNEEMLEYAIQY